jgi:hypothetical protein
LRFGVPMHLTAGCKEIDINWFSVTCEELIVYCWYVDRLLCSLEAIEVVFLILDCVRSLDYLRVDDILRGIV